MDLENLLTILSQHIGSNRLILDDNNVCNIHFDEGVDICFEPDPQENYVHLYCVAGDIPEITSDSLLKLISEQNLFQPLVGLGAITCDFWTKEVLYTQRFNPDHLNADNFIVLVDDFRTSAMNTVLWLSALKHETTSSQPLEPTTGAYPLIYV